VYWRLGPWLQGNKGIKWIKPRGKKGGKGESCRSFRRNIQEGFRLFRSCYFNWKFTEFHILGPGWAGNLFLPAIQSTINLKTEPLNYPTRIQRFEIAEIEFSLVFSTESNGSKWVERGWSMYGSYPLQITPLRTLFRSAFKCRMAPKICASLEIRIGPTWSNCQKTSKAWIVFLIICLNVSSPKYWSMILDVFLFIILTVLTGYVWFEIWWSLVESSRPLRKIQPRCLKPVRRTF
jgi:hypothetical protein